METDAQRTGADDKNPQTRRNVGTRCKRTGIHSEEVILEIPWKTIWWLLALAVILSFTVTMISHNASAAVITQNNTPGNTSYYVYQGDTVYVGDVLDISGDVLPYTELAYWDGFDMYATAPTFTLDLPTTRSGLTHFIVGQDPFGFRLGRWYKYNGAYEPNSNNLAFVVVPAKNVTGLINQGQNSTNITLQNPNQTAPVLPATPLLPVRHVSDYLIARGDGFRIPGNGTANLWVFGQRDSIFDYQSVNSVMNVTPTVINHLSAGSYTMLLQMPKTPASDYAVRYNAGKGAIEWFDPGAFTVNQWYASGQTPLTVLSKLESIFPQTADTYMLFNLSVQEPAISIDRIDVMNQLNDTSADATVSLTPASYLDVKGYTNVAPDTIIQATVDPDFSLSEQNTWKNAIITSSQGTVGGDMREFHFVIPVDLYNLPMGKHFVGVRVPKFGSAVTTGDFTIYGTPTGNYVPNKTIRYISGQYGPEEIVPTPTPVVVTQIVTQVVTQIVTVPVTPSQEVVLAAQRQAAQEAQSKLVNTVVTIMGTFVVVFFVGRFLFKAWKRRKWVEK